MPPPLNTERELLEAVDLCQPDGRLNPAAVGWSRRPVHRCNLKGRWLSKKRWNYWAVTSPKNLFSATVSNLDYAGVVFVYFGDFESGEVIEKTVITPFGRGCALPGPVNESLSFEHRDLRVAFDNSPGSVRISAQTQDFGGEPLHAEIGVTYPEGHETLNVVIPWDKKTFQLTSKHNALPAEGRVQVGSREIRFEGTQSFACLDYGRGIWPRHCAWNWGSASGRSAGGSIGLNLGGKWTDGTGMTENALLIAGRLSKVSEDLIWDYDRSDFMKPWRIRTPQSRQVDLAFIPFLERAATGSLGPIRSGVHQLFGHYRGSIVGSGGERIEIRDLLGWAEEHLAFW